MNVRRNINQPYAVRVVIVVVCLGLVTGASDAEPIRYFEFVKAEPQRVIKHAVELKGPFDAKAMTTPLWGPRFFGHAVSVEASEAATPNAYLNVYEINRPATSEERVVTVREFTTRTVERQITIGQAAYALIPTQHITTGPPSPLDPRLDRYKAYRILKADPGRVEIRLTNGYGTSNIAIVEAAFLCMPVEEWHHEEHFPVHDPLRWMLIYAVKPAAFKNNIVTMDSFGLHTLAATEIVWLGTPVQSIEATSQAPR